MKYESKPVRVQEIAVPVEEAHDPSDHLRRQVQKRLGLSSDALQRMSIVRRALDARHRALRYVFTVDVDLKSTLADRLIQSGRAEPAPKVERARHRLAKKPDGPPPVVIGTGPAGLFAALTLVEAGWAPVVLERGRPVEERGRDVSKLYARGVLDLDSNVCFGEGGAGTYSDGKLYTRVNDPRVTRVMEALVGFGADPDILIDHRPHLGTDRLVALLKRVRAHLQEQGADVRFSTAVEKLSIKHGRLSAIVLRGGERLQPGPTVLATGHSARGIWEQLINEGLPLEARPFAVGFRVEHPQSLINRLRYGAAANREALPPAEYRLTYNDRNNSGRGVYSFCMCPGGVVVPTPTCGGELCINGMSHASRSGRFANSAIVATVTLADYANAGYEGPLAGVHFQRDAERRAYEMGGGGFTAPAARLTDFLNGRSSSRLDASSYRRGLWPAPIAEIFSRELNDTLRAAFHAFDRKMRGFVTDEAALIGVETRTSSPVRVTRVNDFQALGAAGLYPAGEGVGYGGGIISSAVDGVRAAEAILQAHGAQRELIEDTAA